MSGRGRGFCNNFDTPGYNNPGSGRSYGGGGGWRSGRRGRSGFGIRAGNNPPESNQIKSFSDRLSALESNLENLIRKLDK
ncbi:MAG: DUF5320 domain-containing protein [Candidatus Kapaibacterium sp.]